MGQSYGGGICVNRGPIHFINHCWLLLGYKQKLGVK